MLSLVGVLQHATKVEPIDLSFTEGSPVETPSMFCEDHYKSSTDPYNSSTDPRLPKSATNPKVPKSAASDMQREWQMKHFTEESGKGQQKDEKSTADLLKGLQGRIHDLEETTKKVDEETKKSRERVRVT